MTQSVTRRSFLQTSATTGAAALAAPALLGAGAANERLNLAFIGVGGRGGRNLNELAVTTGTKPARGRDARNPRGVPRDDVNVVALCDVNRQNLGRAAEMFPTARTYEDFRKLFDQASDIDAVVVSTTEHTHAYAVLPALQLRKHVYCEKPITHNVVEARLLAEETARAGVATQMGTQIHGMPNYRRVVELIQSGAIGKVRESHTWVSRAWGLQSAQEAEQNGDIVHVTDRPTEAQTPPEHLNWDLWLGPAQYRPFHEVYFPGPKWYRWWDFGNGTMSDLGSHWNDLAWWALKLDAPLTIESFGDEPHTEIAPASMSTVYEYGPRGDMPACKVHWYQGTHKPKIWEEGGIPQWKNGVLFIGEKGMLLSDYGKHVLLPEEDFANFQRPESFIPDSPGQHEEWLLACKTGSATGSPFDTYSGPLTEANHLGNVAFRAGGKIVWDSKNLRITNNDDANQFLTRTPRAGWNLS